MDAVEKIETSLALKVPAAYRAFLNGTTSFPHLDDTSLMRDPDAVIAATSEYRDGFAGLPAWPSSLIYLGDEDDACPYALDVNTGEVLQLDKGNVSRAPLTRYASFADFTNPRPGDGRADAKSGGTGLLEKLLRRPILTGLLIWFIGLPIVVGTIKFLVSSLR